MVEADRETGGRWTGESVLRRIGELLTNKAVLFSPNWVLAAFDLPVGW